MRNLAVLFCFISSTICGQTIFEDITNELDITNTPMASSWGSGISAEDFDKDGDIDLAICSNSSEPARVLRNEGDGTFFEISYQLSFNSRVALWVDYNGDHLMDLIFIGDCLNVEDNCSETITLFEQDEDGNFINVTNETGLLSTNFDKEGIVGGASAADLNEDGFLDILIVYLNTESKLLLSTGENTFEVVNDFFKQGTSNMNWTPILFDITNDGWVDYLQARDLARPNQFWVHNGDLKYHDVSEKYSINHSAENMGIALGDYDNDNDLDIYISNVEYELFDRGNVLFRNDGDVFSNQSKPLNVFRGGWSWGITFMDGNNDGLLDITATNGWDTYGYDSSKYWMNLGNEQFKEVSQEIMFNDILFATSLIAFDIDRDGDLDLGQSVHPQNHSFGVKFYKNQLNKVENENYIVIQPRMRGTNHWAIGAQVKIKTSSGTQMRAITTGTSFFAQEPAEAFFGLGSVNVIDEVEIIWPGGSKSIVEDIPVNQVVQFFDDEVIHPPYNLQTSIVNNTVELTWTSKSTVNSNYIIEKSVSPSFEFFDEVEVDDNILMFVDNITMDTDTVYYRIKAKNDNYITRPSISLSLAVQMKSELETPQDFYGLIRSPVSVELFWTDVLNDEEGYVIQRSTDITFSTFFEIIIPFNVESYLDENLEPGTNYYYRIKVYNQLGESEYSKIFEVNLNDEIVSLVHLSSKSIFIYPNPVDDQLNVDMSNIKLSIQKIQLINTNGTIIAKWSTFQILNNRIQLNVNTIPPGEYILLIEFSSKLYSKKIAII